MKIWIGIIGSAALALGVPGPQQGPEDKNLKPAGFTPDRESDGPAKTTKSRPRRSAASEIKPPVIVDRASEPATPAPPPALPEPGAIFLKPIVLPACQAVLVDEAMVPCKTNGTIVEMLVREGDVVKKDQVLARLDDRLAKLEVESKRLIVENEAPLEASKAKLLHAQTEHKLGIEMFHKGTLAGELLKQRQLEELIAQRGVQNEETKLDAADVELAAAEERLAQHEVRAPFAGVVRHRLKHAGESIQAMEPVVHLIRTDRMRVEGYIDLKVADRIAAGMAVEVVPNVVSGPAVQVVDSAAIHCVKVLADGKRFVFATDDGMLVVWDLARGVRERTIKASAKPIRTLAVSPVDPNVAFAGGDDGAIRVLNLRSGVESQAALRVGDLADDKVCALLVDPKNPATLYSAHADGKLRIWNLKTSAVVKTLEGPDNRTTSLSLSPDGKSLLAACDDRTLRIWNVAEGTATTYDGRTSPGQQEVRQINFSPSGGEFLFNAGPLLQVRSIKDGMPLADIEAPGKNFAFAALFAPKPGLVVVGHADGQIHLWRIVDRRPPRLARVYEGHPVEKAIGQFDFSPDGKFVVSCGEDRTARVWLIPTVEELDAERQRGTVAFVSPQAEKPLRQVQFHVDVDNSTGIFTANASATVIIYPKR